MDYDSSKLRDDAEMYRNWYQRGLISIGTAKILLEPYANFFEAKGEKIAKKYHKRPPKFNYTRFLT